MFDLARIAEDGSRAWFNEAHREGRCLNQRHLQIRIKNLKKAGINVDCEMGALTEMNKRRAAKESDAS